MTRKLNINWDKPKNFTYLGNTQIKKGGVVTAMTSDEVLEFARCRASAKYFAENYIKVIHLDRGLVPFHLYPYQNEMFQHFDNNKFSIVLACRQSGKSISVCAYLLWYVLFHSTKTVAVLANKADTAREMLGRITLMLENLPFFLQQGCKELNKGSMEFSNNSRILSAATSSSSIRGKSVNLLYLDEFAFVENDAKFYTSTYPVITGGKSARVIITSTANGVGNTFHRLWERAVTNTSDRGYKPFRVDWWDVPGRDEEWKKETIENTSELQFSQEFGNSFLGSGSTLISPELLLKLKSEEPEFIQENGSMRVYGAPEPKHTYVMTVDVAQGRGKDYSAFSIFDVTSRPFRQVASYANNTISPLLLPEILNKYATAYNEALVLIESNDQGSMVCNAMFYDIEYENMFVESISKKDGLGLRQTKRTKAIGCSQIKDLLEQSKLTVKDANTIVEICTFEARGSSYEATGGNNDDLMMTLVMFGWFTSTQMFSGMTDIDVRSMLYEERMRAIEDDVLPFGFTDSATSQAPIVEDGVVMVPDDFEWDGMFGYVPKTRGFTEFH